MQTISHPSSLTTPSSAWFVSGAGDGSTTHAARLNDDVELHLDDERRTGSSTSSDSADCMLKSDEERRRPEYESSTLPVDPRLRVGDVLLMDRVIATGRS